MLICKLVSTFFQFMYIWLTSIKGIDVIIVIGNDDRLDGFN
jgi:hypothetical protein